VKAMKRRSVKSKARNPKKKKLADKSNYKKKREYLHEHGKWGFEVEEKPWKQ
jgi:hypothetical protein